MIEAPRYLVANGITIQLIKNLDGFWEDSEGTLYAYYETANTKDPVDRCGVAPLALPTWPIFVKMNDACRPHDFAYSSPVYQAFHYRHDADEYLRTLQSKSGYPIFGWIARTISRLIGRDYWENSKTND